MEAREVTYQPTHGVTAKPGNRLSYLDHGAEPRQQPAKEAKGPGLYRADRTKRRDRLSGFLQDSTTCQDVQVVQEGLPYQSSSGNDECKTEEPGFISWTFHIETVRDEENVEESMDAHDRIDGHSRANETTKEEQGAQREGDLTQEQFTQPRSGDPKPPGLRSRGAKPYISNLMTRLNEPGVPSSTLPLPSTSERTAEEDDTSRTANTLNKSKRARMLRMKLGCRRSAPNDTRIPSSHRQSENEQGSCELGHSTIAAKSKLDIKSEAQPHHLPIRDRWRNHSDQSQAQTTQSNSSTTRSSVRHTRNTLDTGNSGALLDQETTRTWRGLFASVRELSHPASTTGSSTRSLSTSSSNSTTAAQGARSRNLHTERKPKSSLQTLSSEYKECEKKQLPKGSTPRKLSIVIVGDGAVGKSALTLRFLRDQ